MRAVDRDDEEQPEDCRIGEAPDEDDREAGQPVGELPGRQGEQQDRQELGEADQSQIEGAVADRVHLPADRNGSHLHREARAEHRRPEPAEVAVEQRWRQRRHVAHSAFFGPS